MNNTKWDELRLAMYSLEPTPRWRTKDVDSGYESDWDREWFYHFREGGYDTIEWVEIEVPPETERETILKVLRQIHVPGEPTELGFRVFGYSPSGESVDYL